MYDTFTGNTVSSFRVNVIDTSPNHAQLYLQPHRSLFAMVDPKQHGIHRRLTAFNFSEKWIDPYLQPFIARNTRLAIDRMMEEERTKGYVDVFKWHDPTNPKPLQAFANSSLLITGSCSWFVSGTSSCIHWNSFKTGNRRNRRGCSTCLFGLGSYVVSY